MGCQLESGGGELHTVWCMDKSLITRSRVDDVTATFGSEGQRSKEKVKFIGLVVSCFL